MNGNKERDTHTIDIKLRIYCKEAYAERLAKRIKNYIKKIVAYEKLIEVEGGVR